MYASVVITKSRQVFVEPELELAHWTVAVLRHDGIGFARPFVRIVVVRTMKEDHHVGIVL